MLTGGREGGKRAEQAGSCWARTHSQAGSTAHTSGGGQRQGILKRLACALGKQGGGDVGGVAQEAHPAAVPLLCASCRELQVNDVSWWMSDFQSHGRLDGSWQAT